MGVMSELFSLIFGGGRNVIRETAEVFRENSEAGAERAQIVQTAAMAQFAAEYGQNQRGWFDRIMDGINRLPRPALALGTLGLFIAAMADPLWFAERMQGIALVPEPLWWLLGVIVSFYFGARHQVKNQQFQRDIAETMVRAPQVVANINRLQKMRADSPGVAKAGDDAQVTLAVLEPEANRALSDWRALRA